MLTQDEYITLRRRLKTAQTKLRNCPKQSSISIEDQKDPRVKLNHALLLEALTGHERFRQDGFPDDWHAWERAAEDARWALRFVWGNRVG